MTLTKPPTDPAARRDEDPLLARFHAGAAAEREAELRRLIEDVAAPVIHQAVARKAGVTPRASGRFEGTRHADALDAEDAASVARQRVARRLVQSGEPITDFRGYCATVAYNAWSEALHRRFPSRRRLVLRVRYLLEGATSRGNGFALWTDGNVEVVGLAAGEGRQRPLEAAAVGNISEQAGDFLRSHFRGRSLLRLQPAALLRGIFEALAAPVRWSDLEHLLVALWEADGGRGEGGARIATAERLGRELISPAASPDVQMSWIEHLRWLWQGVLGLSLRQRTAFLLHATVTRDFEYEGIAPIRTLAAALEIEPGEFAELWVQIPLEDALIAARLGLARQQVINLRKSARIALGRKLSEYLRN